MKFDNLKIVIILLIAFGFAFGTVYLMDDLLDSSTVLGKKITITPSPNIDLSKPRIFLIGSSRMMGIDAEFIENYTLQQGKDIHVNNQGLSGDIPSTRLLVLNATIFAKPDIVFIGVDLGNYLDRKPLSTSNTNTQFTNDPCSNKLPAFEQLVSEVLPKERQILGVDLTNFENPKLTTLKLLSNAFPKSFKVENTEEIPDHFYASLTGLGTKQSWRFDEPVWRILATEQQIEAHIDRSIGRDTYTNPVNPFGYQANALRDIIEKLQEKNIKVVLFTTPIYKTLLEEASPCGIADFDKFLNSLSEDYGVTVYKFHDKYSNLNIWRDAIHIVWGDKGQIYSKDVAKMVLEELK